MPDSPQVPAVETATTAAAWTPRRHSIRAVLTRQLFGASQGLTGLTIGIAGLLVAALWDDAPHAVLVAWLLTVLASEGYSLWVRRCYYSVTDPPPRLWQRRFAHAALGWAVAWSGSAVFVIWPLNEHSPIVIGALLIGICAVLLNSVSSYYALYRCLVLIMVFPCGLALLLLSPLWHINTLVATIGIAVTAKLMDLSRRIHRARVGAIRAALSYRHLHRSLRSERNRRRDIQHRLLRASDFDAVTGLPNQKHFFHRTRRLLTAQQAVPPAHRRNIVIMLIDLDGFMQVNNTYGRKAGDHLLAQIGARLKALLPASAGISRLGDDEFALAVPLPFGVREVSSLVQRIRSKIEEPVPWGDSEIEITSSIGFCITPEHGVEVEDVLRKADIALRRAKETKGPRQIEFRADMEAAVNDRLSLEHALRRALANGELSLTYQPVVRLHDGRLVAAEALLRWKHPEHGEVSPDVFIPLAEQIGLIGEIGAWALDGAISQASRWHRARRMLGISVNVSVQQLMDADFPQLVSDALRRHGLSGSYLRLEITESVIMSDPAALLHLIEQIRQLDVKIALDDFGTGYSSLSYLAQLDIDYLKLDKGLVHNISRSRRSAAIVRSTLAMAGALDVTVVAEGIESEDDWRKLRAEGCPYGQGFYFSAAVSGADFETLPARYEVPSSPMEGSPIEPLV